MFYRYVDSPIGPLLLAGRGEALEIVSFAGGSKTRAAEPGWACAEQRFSIAVRQLNEYFEGRRREFDVPVLPAGTPFQLRVLAALRAIPYGETRSYGEIARAIGRPDAVRAVGAANGSNPIPIIFPCHRVIGANGSLTGFGGGLDRKRFLLDLEAGISPLRF